MQLYDVAIYTRDITLPGQNALPTKSRQEGRRWIGPSAVILPQEAAENQLLRDAEVSIKHDAKVKGLLYS